MQSKLLYLIRFSQRKKIGMFKRQWIVPIAISSTALILMILSIVSPWWSIHHDEKLTLFDRTVDLDLGTQGITKKDRVRAGNVSEELVETYAYSDLGCKSISGTFGFVFLVAISSLAVISVSLIACILSSIGRLSSRLPIILSAMAAVVVLASGAILYNLLPSAVSEDINDLRDICGCNLPQINTFYGKEVGENVHIGNYSWGPSTGWYLAFAVSILTMISSISIAFMPTKRLIEEEAEKGNKEGRGSSSD